MSYPRFAAGLSDEPDAAHAEDQCLQQLESCLGGASPNLIVAFATPNYGSDLKNLGLRLSNATGCENVIGCSASSVLGGARELQGRPGMSVWAACAPNTSIRPFEVTAAQGSGDAIRFSETPPVRDTRQASLIMVADPFSFPMDRYLLAVDEAVPGVPMMGGMASGGSAPEQNLLFSSDGSRTRGALGVVIEGDLELVPVVSQGCRPVGRPWVVTACERNLIRKLGGKTALDVLMHTFQELPTLECGLLQRAPFLGLAIDAAKSDLKRGDFLVRHVMGIQQDTGAIAIADFVRKGMTVQFLVRDASSAAEDLRALLRPHQGPSGSGAGALLFTCTGRGTHMFPGPDHDATCIRDALSTNSAISGFFCSGEIGPVGGRNFLHGFTASVAVFRQRATL